MALVTFISRKKERLSALSERRALVEPTALFAPYSDRLRLLTDRMKLAVSGAGEKARIFLRLLAEKADAISPLSVLARGYCVPEREGHTVASVSELSEGDGLTLRFADGSASARVEACTKKNIMNGEK